MRRKAEGDVMVGLAATTRRLVRVEAIDSFCTGTSLRGGSSASSKAMIARFGHSLGSTV